MKILTFDTALNKTYIALSDNETIIEKPVIENSEDKYHSAFLIQEISNILKRNNLKMQDIDALGINIGPGSFTGIRACVTVGRVIAQQINAPLVGVSSLEILSRINDNDEQTLVTLDARKNSAYVAMYKNKKQIEAPNIVKLETLYKKAANCRIICDTAICEKLKENNIEAVNYEIKNYPLNDYLAQITFEKLMLKNDDFNWAKVKPLYIQPPSIFGK